MTEDIYKTLHLTYKNRFLEYGNSPKSVFWNDSLTQYLRFKILTEKYLRTQNKKISVLDLGAGLGDLYQYLSEQNIECQYTGIEMIEEMVNLAKSNHPNAAFIQEDFRNFRPIETYNLIVLCGIFYYCGNGNQKAWKNFVTETISNAFKHAKDAIVFNFLTDSNNFSDENLYYFSSGELLNFCTQNLSRFVSIEQSYPLFEASITVWKPEYIASQFPNKELEKYL